jgi:hypothetical protein
MFELHYGRGGHGGPYPTVQEAITAAEARVKVEGTIAIRRGVGGPLEAVVSTRPKGLVCDPDTVFVYSHAALRGPDIYPGRRK